MNKRTQNLLPAFLTELLLLLSHPFQKVYFLKTKMAKQQQLSPEKYITTKARMLPIDRCYVTSKWEETQIVNVVVMRRHVNGNVTVGLYLVDLLCLGVKDTFYAFNISEKEANERFIESLFEIEEVDYDLAHNIVYAGHDFALEFDIKPHKDFNLTKYILEEDTEKVPIIDIPVGDANGNPSLVVSPSYNYGTALQKLKQHAGEGNYTFIIQDSFAGDDFDENDEDLDEDELDQEDEFDEDDDVKLIDFDIVSNMEKEELEEIIEEQSETLSNSVIIITELLLRTLHEEEGGILINSDLLKETKDYQLFEKGRMQWDKSLADTNESLQTIYPQLRDIGTNPDGLSHEDLMAEAVELLDKYKSEDITGYMIVNSIPLITVLSEIKTPENNFEDYTPSVQLFIASYVVLIIKDPVAKYQFLLNANTVAMAYPFNRHIHGFHHRLFWHLQAIHAIQQNNKEKILHYHNLLRISGTGGNLKFLYAGQLETWLKRYMGLYDEEDDSEDLDMQDDNE